MRFTFARRKHLIRSWHFSLSLSKTSGLNLSDLKAFMPLIISTFLKCQWAGAERRPTGLSLCSSPAIKQDLQYKSAWQTRRDGVYQTRAVLGTNCVIIWLAFCLRCGRISHDGAEKRWTDRKCFEKMKNVPSSISQKRRPSGRPRQGRRKGIHSLSCLKMATDLTMRSGGRLRSVLNQCGISHWIT